MDTRTGNLYPTKAAAQDAGVPDADLVEIIGPPRAVKRLRTMVRTAAARRQAKREQQHASRKANRR